MEIECTFSDCDWPFTTSKFYRCYIEKQQIPDDAELEIEGNHKSRRTNNDVTFVKFFDCTITKVPVGLTKFFPNMKILEINCSKLDKICKNDLVEYKNLEKFSCWGNEIEFLSGDLFEGFQNLEWVSFYGNKLRIIEPNIFDKLGSLKRLQLEHNPSFDILYSTYPKEKTKMTFDDVKNALFEKFFASDPQVIKNFIMKLEKPIEELKIYSKKIKNTEKKLEMMEIRAEIFEELTNLKIENLENSKLNLAQEVQQLKMTTKNLEENLSIEKQENSNLVINFQKQIDHLSSQMTNGIFGDLKKFLQNRNIKDFKIIIEGQEFLVHKFLLAARSPTLAEIIFNNPAVDQLNLVDIPVNVFEKILKFFYTDEFPREDGTNFLPLFAAAGKLKVEELRIFAAQNCFSELNPENSFEVFNLAKKYDHEELMKKAFVEIKKKYSTIDFKEEWTAEPEKMIKVIEVLKRKEEAMRKIEEEVECMITETVIYKP